MCALIEESLFVEVQRQVAAFTVGSTSELPEGLAYPWSSQLNPKAHATPMALLSRLSFLESLPRSLIVRRAKPALGVLKKKQTAPSAVRSRIIRVCASCVLPSDRETCGSLTSPTIRRGRGPLSGFIPSGVNHIPSSSNHPLKPLALKPILSKQ